MKVKIPFKAEFKDRILSGRKTCTSRTKKYGEVGDTFDAFGAEFILDKVLRVNLNFVAYNFYKEEGFEAPAQFIVCWNKIHPNLWDNQLLVWVHFFRIGRPSLTSVYKTIAKKERRNTNNNMEKARAHKGNRL